MTSSCKLRYPKLMLSLRHFFFFFCFFMLYSSSFSFFKSCSVMPPSWFATFWMCCSSMPPSCSPPPTPAIVPVSTRIWYLLMNHLQILRWSSIPFSIFLCKKSSSTSCLDLFALEMIGKRKPTEIKREQETAIKRYKKRFKEDVRIPSVATIIACVDSLSAPRRELRQLSYMNFTSGLFEVMLMGLVVIS